MPLLKTETASERERRKNGDSTNPSGVDEFTAGESKGGALTGNTVRLGMRHGGAAGAGAPPQARRRCLACPLPRHHEPGLWEPARQTATGL